jgi:hypothetical protein
MENNLSSLNTTALETLGPISEVWDHVYSFLKVLDVAKCAATCTSLNKFAQQRFHEVPVSLHVENQHEQPWDVPAKPSTAFDERHNGVQQHDVLVNKEKPFVQIHNMIMSALDLEERQTTAVDVLYCGMMVSPHRYRDCNPPTFFDLQEGRVVHNVYLVIRFAYLEWQHVMRTIPIDTWLLRMADSPHALMFRQGYIRYNHEVGKWWWQHNDWNSDKGIWYKDPNVNSFSNQSM